MTNSSGCKVCKSEINQLYSNIFDNRHGFPKLHEIKQCSYCGYCRTDPALKREELADVYQKYYPRNSLTIQQVEAGFKAARQKSKFVVWLQGGGTECYRYIDPGSRVLDVGCGNCISLLMLKALGAKEVVGIEVDQNLRKIADALNLDLHVGQLSDLPESRGKFDFILARQVIEHDPEPKKFLSEMKNRLKEDGQIILSFPNVNSFYRSIFKHKWLHWHVPYHINHFTKKSVEVLASNSGLQVKSICTITPNAWISYQLRLSKVHIEVGQRDTFGDPGVAENIMILPTAPWKWLPGRMRQKLQQYFTLPLILIINRLLDFLGLGESLVVVLSR